MANGTAKGGVEVVELSRLQQSVGRRMAESRATVPHLTVAAPAGAPAPDAALIAAVGAALRAVPQLNASYRDGRGERYARVNVGVAVVTPGGVAMPTIVDADAKAAGEIAAELDALGARARAGELTAPDQAGATFTVSGLGLAGLSRVEPVIVPPQAAGLGVGTAELTLACDARLLHAGDAAAFLGRLAAALATGA